MQEAPDNVTEFLSEDLHIEMEPSQEQIELKAIDMGMDLEADADLMYLARDCLTAPLPKYWKPVVNSKGESYYVDLLKGVAYEEHPVDMHYQRLYEKARKVGRGKTFARFKLEEVSTRLPLMVRQKQKELNILVQLNPISQIQTERNQEEQKTEGKESEDAQSAGLSDRAFIFVGSDDEEQPEKAQADEVEAIEVVHNPQASFKERILQIQREEQQILENKLKKNLDEHNSVLQKQLEEWLNNRRMELVSDINCHRMDKQEEIDVKKQSIDSLKSDANKQIKARAQRYIAYLEGTCGLQVENQFEKQLIDAKLKQQKRLLRTKILIQKQDSRRVRMFETQQKLKGIYKKLLQVETRRQLMDCRLQYYRKFLSQFSAAAQRYQLANRTVKFDNKENIHENCIDYFKQQIRKSQALDTYDGLTRNYFKKQRKLSLISKPTKQSSNGLMRQWDSLEKMRLMINHEQYSQVRELSKTIKGGEAKNFIRDAAQGDDYQLYSLTSRVPKLQTPHLYPHSTHKPRLVPKLYRKVI